MLQQLEIGGVVLYRFPPIHDGPFFVFFFKKKKKNFGVTRRSNPRPFLEVLVMAQDSALLLFPPLLLFLTRRRV